MKFLAYTWQMKISQIYSHALFRLRLEYINQQFGRRVGSSQIFVMRLLAFCIHLMRAYFSLIEMMKCIEQGALRNKPENGKKGEKNRGLLWLGCCLFSNSGHQ